MRISNTKEEHSANGSRAEIPARKGWREFLKTAQIDKSSDNNYRNLWKYKSICLTVRHINLTEAYALIRVEKRRGRLLTTDCGKDDPKKLCIMSTVLNSMMPEYLATNLSTPSVWLNKPVAQEPPTVITLLPV